MIAIVEKRLSAWRYLTIQLRRQTDQGEDLGSQHRDLLLALPNSLQRLCAEGFLPTSRALA